MAGSALKCGFARICGRTSRHNLPRAQLHESTRIVNDLAIRPGRCRQSDDGGDYALGEVNERAMDPGRTTTVGRTSVTQAGGIKSA